MILSTEKLNNGYFNICRVRVCFRGVLPFEKVVVDLCLASGYEHGY